MLVLHLYLMPVLSYFLFYKTNNIFHCGINQTALKNKKLGLCNRTSDAPKPEINKYQILKRWFAYLRTGLDIQNFKVRKWRFHWGLPAAAVPCKKVDNRLMQKLKQFKILEWKSIEIIQKHGGTNFYKLNILGIYM